MYDEIPLVQNGTGQASSATAAPILNQSHFSQIIYPISRIFPRLPVLDKIIAHLKEINQLPDLKNVVFIGVQHLLQTTGSLIEALIALGADPKNIFISGKCYSTDPEVVKKLRDLGVYVIEGTTPKRTGDYEKAHNHDVKGLWQALQEHCKTRTTKKIIILSDGPALIENAPSLDISSAAIEQTRHGRYSPGEEQSPFPIVNVAQSAAKQKIEPLFIQKAAINRLKSVIDEVDKNNTIIGVAGYGAIGKALVKYLHEAGYKVLVYDRDPSVMNTVIQAKNVEKASSLSYLMVNSNITFGCTGQDITEEVDLLAINGKDRTLISMSSGGNEFDTLIRQIQSLLELGKKASLILKPLADIEIKTKMGNKITIKKSGFPINFDRSETPDPEEEFSLTRGLLLMGVLQALRLDKNNTRSRNVMLSPYAQRLAVRFWKESLNTLRDDSQIKQLPLNEFVNIDWISNNSVGDLLIGNNQDSFCAANFASRSGIKAKI